MIDFTKAYITLKDGSHHQVLLEDGSDWDEEATKAAVEQYIASQPAPTLIQKLFGNG